MRLYRILTVGWEAIRSIDGLVVQLSLVTPYTRVRFPLDAMDCIFLVSFHFLTRNDTENNSVHGLLFGQMSIGRLY